MAKAIGEVTGGILRVGADGMGPRDKYDFTVSFIGDEGTALLKGLRTECFTHAHRVAIFAELRRMGFQKVAWRRRKLEQPPKVVEFNL